MARELPEKCKDCCNCETFLAMGNVVIHNPTKQQLEEFFKDGEPDEHEEAE